jgi:prefoldin subunit 5
MEQDIPALEAKLQRLSQSLSELTRAKHADKLLAMIRRPGWTTPQEAELVHAAVDMIQHQIDGVNRSGAALVRIADKIGRS